MKKLLALLLVLALLPCAAFAEGSSVTTVSWTADAEAVAAWLKASGMEDGAAQAIAEPAADLMNALSLVLRTQEGETASIAVRLQDTDVLTVSVGTLEDGSKALQTSLLPELTLILGEDQIAPFLNWPDVKRQAAKIMADWLGTLETVRENGRFIGDAYQGGAVRVTYTMEDRDLAVLGMQLLQNCGRSIAYVHQGWMDGLLQQFAFANAGSMRLSLVYDGEGTLTGGSVNLLSGEEILMTVSFGVQQDGLRLVLSWRENGKNHYLQLDGTVEDRNLTVTCMAWRCAADKTFSCVTDDELVFAGTADIEWQTGNGIEWQGGLSDNSSIWVSGYAGEKYGFAFSGSLTKNGLQQMIRAVYGDEQSLGWTCTVATAEADAMPAMTVTEQTVDISDGVNDDEDNTLYNTLTQGGMALAGYVALVPASVLSFFVSLFN